MTINLDRILGLDIETAPILNFGEENPLWDTWVHRNRKLDLTNEELLEKFNTEAGLYAEYSTIVCISIGFKHNDSFVVTSFTGDEKDIIDECLEKVEKFRDSRGGVQFLGHNIQNFDACYMRKAYSKYHPMFTYPEYMTDLGLKPWTAEDRFLDTLQVWKGMNFMFSSMAEVAIHLGLPSPKSDTDGSMVADLFRKGDVNRIVKYCEGDVYTSFNILCKWMGIDILPMKVLNEDIEQPSILKRGIISSEISEKSEEKINKVIATLTEDEQVIARDIMTAVTTKTKIQKKKK